jgi:hypothetical protein
MFMRTHFRAFAVRCALFWAIFVGALSPLSVFAQEEKGAGVVIGPEAKAKDVGLSMYPGSKPRKEKDDDSTSANLGLWGGGSGFKLVILKMETGDSPSRVAEYYKKELSKYGTVLDCSKNSGNSENAAKEDSSKVLTCGDDKPESGGQLFKAGTKEKQHIVGIQSLGKGTYYQLIYVSAWGTGGKK